MTTPALTINDTSPSATESRTEALERARAYAELAACGARGPQLLLWAATTREHATICRGDGTVIWRQRLTDLPGPAAESELDAIEANARQAIWIAGQARLEWGAQAGRLCLIVDRYRRSLLTALHRHAYVAGLALELLWDPINNPARQNTGDTTSVDWRPHQGIGELLAHRRTS